MKNIATLLLACTCVGATGFVYAAGGTCAAPGSLSPTNAAGTASGNTCTDGTGGTATANQVASYCGLQDLSSQPQEVYKVSLAAAGTAGRTATSLSISSTTASFSASMYLFPGATSTDCANGGPPCGNAGDKTGAIDLTAGDAAVAAAGTYYLVIGASQLEAHSASACGDYNLAWNNALPVKLQGFSVQ